MSGFSEEHKLRKVTGAEEGFVRLVMTSNRLWQALATSVREKDLSVTQYNALRILREVYPDGIGLSALGGQLITTEPDMTRMVRRLVGRGLIEKARSRYDRRVMEVFITEEGLGLLQELDGPISEILEDKVGRLGEKRLNLLIELLKLLR